MSFTEPPPPIGGPSGLLLDDISFSPNAVPEPNTLALTALGGLLFVLYRRLAPKRPENDPVLSNLLGSNRKSLARSVGVTH
ncbi:MAG: PEP-CTERM sorting domain-containing protein [Limisphaerales bacterium]